MEIQVPTQVTHHLFNYPTHAVVWSTYYNPYVESPNAAAASSLYDRTPDGGEMWTYCNFYLTEQAAYDACHGCDDFPECFMVTIIHHMEG